MARIFRTAADFDEFYAAPDPWKATKTSSRDKVLLRIVARYATGKSVLELGCGEGQHTATLMNSAAHVTGVDISPVAIGRANSAGLSNAAFIASDFLSVPFAGYDLLTAIECVYYLSMEEREDFFQKIAEEHKGKPFIFSAPIIGSNEYRTYFTHNGVLDIFARHRISIIEIHNLGVYRKSPAANRLLPLLRQLLSGCHLAIICCRGCQKT